MDSKKLNDRIGKYLTPYLQNYLFDELSENYLKKAGLDDILTGVSVPVRRDEVETISTLSIAKGMAFVMGCDPTFQYVGNYVAYILRISDKRFAGGLVAEGVEAAQEKDYITACIYFRAAMIIDPENIDALYCYGRACKDAYEQGEEEDYIARFKAESIEAFEKVTLRKPDFAEAYYFLGYGYINLGLYVKAKLTWEDFIRLSADEEKKKEIEERLANLTDPVKIEEGYNAVMAGRFEEGLNILTPYKTGKYSDWWPLWYYIGTAHQVLAAATNDRAMMEEAIEDFKKVLLLSPSNREAMDELVRAYEAIGDDAMVEKYKKKLAIVAENAEKDREEARKGTHSGKVN